MLLPLPLFYLLFFLSFFPSSKPGAKGYQTPQPLEVLPKFLHHSLLSASLNLLTLLSFTSTTSLSSTVSSHF
jgi:hypothetical protein